MNVKGIDHVSLNVKDIKASKEFYGQVLGFRQMETVPFDGFSLVYFQIPGGGRLELFDYGGKNPAGGREETEAGLRHLAFEVDDVDEAARRLAAAGVKITLPPTDLPTLGSRAILFLDPNGVTLEYCQKLKV
jgi:catechol 2,3-dioxygenase-like lactoylglutathione lyase family enzyme